MSKSFSNTYEMFWDCQHCGTIKLLGITHRHCPNCGAAQDETARYFPEDGEEISLLNHTYYGVDWDCQFCSTPNSNKSNNCVNCGGPKNGSYQVDLVGDDNKIEKIDKSLKQKISGPPEYERMSSHENKNTQNKSSAIENIRLSSLSSSRKIENNTDQDINKNDTVLKKIITLLFALFFVFSISFLIYGINHKTPTEGTIISKSWFRITDIQEYKVIHDSSWCSSMPSDGYNISRQREIKKYDQVKTGEICKTVKSDNGDGSFSKNTSCNNTYKDVPVYADMCHYSINRWKFSHSYKANGTEQDEPRWPLSSSDNLSEIHSVGNKRARHGDERYSVVFSYLDDNKSKTVTCGYSQTTWENLKKYSKQTLVIRMIGGVSCP